MMKLLFNSLDCGFFKLFDFIKPSMFLGAARNDYQVHIDGIRAIAVIAVILFHANTKWLPGGFIGVDIFFVISGYLISGIIYQQSLRDAFSFKDFYIKRIRRILPLLIVVILVSLPVAWMILLPDEMRSYSGSIFSSLLMYSNLQFLGESGYFDAESHLKPLLHTWSLSIEAQFYFLFPIVLILLLKLSKRPVYLIGTLAFVSLFAADMASQINTEKSFFYFFARAWELLAGCLMMLLTQQTNKPEGVIEEMLSFIGLALVVYALIFFDKMMLHPGKQTVIPVVGSMLLIVFATKKTLVGRLLTSPIMVGIGLISYSLYLWHQPVIVFAKLTSERLSLTNWMMIFVLIIGLSIFSWRYIETPFRSQKTINPRLLLTLVAGFTFVLISIGIWGFKTNGFIDQRFSPDKVSLLKDLDGNRYGTFLFKHLYAKEVIKAKFKKNGKPRLLIVGDSFAADFMNMVVYNDYFSNFQIRSLYIPARCQFYMGDKKYRQLIDERDEKLCEQAQVKLALLKQNLEKVDQVVFAFDWKPWVARHIGQSITALNYQGSRKLIFIGSKRFFVDKRKLLSYDSKDLFKLTSKRSDAVIGVNKILSNKLQSHTFVDQDEVFCGTSNQCILFTSDNRPVTIDGQHLTPEGAKYLGRLLFEHKELASLQSSQ